MLVGWCAEPDPDGPLRPGNRVCLHQLLDAYKPKGTPVIVDDVVRDIDSIVKQSRYTGWNETQEGDRTVRIELRMTLKKYALPLTGPLFDNAYAYIRENY
jgi:type I restriction enzyme, R subunit